MGRRAAVTFVGRLTSTTLAACSSGSGDPPASPSVPPRRGGFTFGVIGDYPYVPEDVPQLFFTVPPDQSVGRRTVAVARQSVPTGGIVGGNVVPRPAPP